MPAIIRIHLTSVAGRRFYFFFAHRWRKHILMSGFEMLRRCLKCKILQLFLFFHAAYRPLERCFIVFSEKERKKEKKKLLHLPKWTLSVWSLLCPWRTMNQNSPIVTTASVRRELSTPVTNYSLFPPVSSGWKQEGTAHGLMRGIRELWAGKLKAFMFLLLPSGSCN